MSAVATPPKFSAYQDGDFVVLEDVPVFKEHVDRDGNEFTREDMEAIVERCNERIDDTNDFPVLHLNHNSWDKDDAESKKPEPKTVGFMGPFKLKQIGQYSKKWGIVARMLIFKDDAAEVRRYPRTSVEYYAEKSKPTRGYFESAALLGSVPAELDLGVRHYCRSPKEDEIHRSYERNCGDLKRYEAACASGGNTFVPGEAEIRRQYDKESEMLDLDNPETAQKLMALLTPTFKAMIDEALAPILKAEEEEAKPDAEPADVAAEHADMLNQYGDKNDEDGARGYLDGMADEDKQKVAAVYSKLPEDNVHRQFYAKVTAPKVELPEAAAKYAKERDEYRAKYSKLVAEHNTAKAELETLKAEKAEATKEATRQTRYSKLVELQSAGYALDIEEEVKDAADLTDEQFAKHCDKIARCYSRLPLNRRVTVAKPGKLSTEGEGVKREKYSKQAVDRAAEKSIDYVDALKEVITEGGDDPAKFGI